MDRIDLCSIALLRKAKNGSSKMESHNNHSIQIRFDFLSIFLATKQDPVVLIFSHNPWNFLGPLAGNFITYWGPKWAVDKSQVFLFFFPQCLYLKQ